MSRSDGNTVFYRLYPLSTVSDWEELRLHCLQTLSKHLNVVWNAEGFTLVVEAECTQPHLSGRVWFDSSIEDEWYVVWLLRCVTEQLPIAVHVWDDDGEFILIEAAEVLPAWLTPDNSDNRLFLYQGRFVLIPQPTTPAQLPIFPQNTVSIEQALCCVSKVPHGSSLDKRLNETINKRLSKFPNRSLHTIRCVLPVPLVHALAQSPSLISALVSVYLYSDQREIQTITRSRKLDWSDTCHTNVQLTRCQYAQLYSQRVTTANAWKHAPVGHSDHTARQLGLKITLGAEIALSIAAEETVTDKEWGKYLKRLEQLGYFEGNIEGSKAHGDLMRRAEVYYRASQKQDSGSLWLSSSRVLKSLVSENLDNFPRYQEQEVAESESDSWMDEIPQEIEKWFLKGREKDNMESASCVNKEKNKKEEPIEEISTDNALSDLNSKLQGFINQISSHEGAEVPDPEVNFNVDDFMSCLQELKDSIDAQTQQESDSDDTSSLDSGSIRTESDEEMQEYMRDIDQQLQGTSLSQTFEKDADGDVDIDLNLVSNILNSFSAESGLSGPASSVLASLGVHLPRDCSDIAGS